MYKRQRLQTVQRKAKVEDLLEANKVVDYAKNTHDQGITFKSGIIDWPNLMNNVVLTVPDASHGSEYEIVAAYGPDGEEIEQLEPFRSQGGRILAIASREVLELGKTKLHVIAWGSTVIRRVCRATVQAETYNLQEAAEHGDLLRAALVDIAGGLGDDKRRWEAVAASKMIHLWVTDCRSAVDALSRPVMAKIKDKRLGIEVASLRQNLWRRKDLIDSDPRELDDQPAVSHQTDRCVWCDTDVMMTDPLTKVMDAAKLLQVLDTNERDLTQPIESIQKKRLKQIQRRKTTIEDEADNKEAK